MTIREMLEAHPQPAGGDRDVIVRCIEACIDCAAVVHELRRRRPRRERPAGDGALHSPVPRLRRRLRRHPPHRHPPDRLDVDAYARRLRPAPRRAAPRARSARDTPNTTSTAGSAPRCAAAASRHAAPCSRRSADKAPGFSRAGGASGEDAAGVVHRRSAAVAAPSPSRGLAPRSVPPPGRSGAGLRRGRALSARWPVHRP